MRKNRMTRWVLAIVICLAMTGCAKDINNPDSGRVTVAVSIVPQKAFVEAVCKDLAEVVVLVPPGYSPESYEPTPKETEKFLRAKIYFTIGVPAESAKILSGAEGTGDMKIVRLEEKAALCCPDRVFDAGDRDPHIWLSPKRVRSMIEAIAEEMSLLDPDNKETYGNNAKEYIEELKKLDNRITELFSGIENRLFIVFHPAFGYLADDYGLDMRSLEEEGKEATAQGLREMIDLAKSEDVKVIFFQAEASSRQAVAFAEEIGGSAVVLDPLSEDYINNMEHMANAIAGAMK